MRVSSIDDAVEQWIHDVVPEIGHLGGRIRSLGCILTAHSRRIIVAVSAIALGFLFRQQVLLTIAIALFVFGVLPFWIEHAIRDAKDVRASHPSLTITRARASETDAMVNAGPPRKRESDLHGVISRQ